MNELDFLSGRWSEDEVKKLFALPLNKQDKFFQKFYRKHILGKRDVGRGNILNPSLAKKGSWAGAVITNYHLLGTPDPERMFMITEENKGERIVLTHYYNVSPTGDLVHLVPYVPLIRLREEVEIHSIPSEGTYHAKIIKPGSTDLIKLSDLKILIFPLQDRMIFPRKNLDRKIASNLITKECAFTAKGFPYPIIAIPEELKLAFL